MGVLQDLTSPGFYLVVFNRSHREALGRGVSHYRMHNFAIRGVRAWPCYLAAPAPAAAGRTRRRSLAMDHICRCGRGFFSVFSLLAHRTASLSCQLTARSVDQVLNFGPCSGWFAPSHREVSRARPAWLLRPKGAQGHLAALCFSGFFGNPLQGSRCCPCRHRSQVSKSLAR